MLVTLGDKKYAVKFRHETVGTPVLNSKGIAIPNSGRYSQCSIREISTPECCGFGYAKVHPTDPFVKETGRMLSLLKALEDGGFSREEKRIICLAYKNRKPTI